VKVYEEEERENNHRMLQMGILRKTSLRQTGILHNTEYYDKVFTQQTSSYFNKLFAGTNQVKSLLQALHWDRSRKGPTERREVSSSSLMGPIKTGPTERSEDKALLKRLWEEEV